MNKTLIFLCISCVLIVFCIITLCCGPMINYDLDWDNQNCKIYADTHEYIDKTYSTGKDDYLKFLKKGQHLCERTNAMHGLEYASFISVLFFGVLCSLLSLLHYFGIGKFFEKITGIIGLACGVIGFILTLIYIIYSGYIFTNDGPGKNYSYSTTIPSTFSPYDNAMIKLNKERAYAEWKDNKYECLYYDADDEGSFYAKYSDLGKKQYNYHKDFGIDASSEFQNCQESSISTIISFCKNLPSSIQSNGGVECKSLYYDSNGSLDNFGNKYLYDKWVTTIIFGCFIIALNIGLAVFGFLLFKQSDGLSGPVTLQ